MTLQQSVQQSDDTRREFLLASMRAGVSNLKSWVRELEMIGVGLSKGHITLDYACDWLDELGLLAHLPPYQDQVDAGEAA
jgi:hypothetical protein